MQRTTAIAVGFLFALGVALIVLVGRHPEHSDPTATTSSHPATASPSASAIAAAAPTASATSGAAEDSAAEAEIPPTEGFDTLPDGRKVPELPASAPKEVSFGVVLFTYQGAQAAPKDARTKEEAKQKARGVIAEAKHDFAAAVSKGDHGSTTDAGRVPRDVLEPAVEYVLFMLQKGDVHPEPVDTPRGYWVIRRNN